MIADHGDPHKLDKTLDRIFRIAKHFNAVLLVDVPDVFMERRSDYLDSHNRLVTIFLRKLEYYEGILFLTTNRVEVFDDAILSRITLKIKYQDLTRDARREIWEYFLSKANTPKGSSIIRDSDLERLEGLELNGREVCLQSDSWENTSADLISNPDQKSDVHRSSTGYGRRDSGML